MSQRKFLNEISLVRPILILLLVLYHSFAPWTGSWSPFNGFEQNKIYWWIGQFAYSFMLPMFIFISGYVWAFQRETLIRKDSFRQLCIKKFKRLYIPSLIFSTVYILLYKSPPTSFAECIDYVSHILKGVGHMWFLPMLFWCFVFCYFILIIPYRSIRRIIVVFLPIISVLPLPLQMNQACFYLVFFYFGYEIMLISDRIRNLATKFTICCISILFVALFVTLIQVNMYLQECSNDIHVLYKVCRILIINLCRIIYASVGIFAIILIAIRYTSNHVLSKLTIEIGTLCFGIYLYQQFILIFLYYHTDLPVLLGNIMLPWLGFIITLSCSILLTYFTKLTDIGKKLI